MQVRVAFLGLGNVGRALAAMMVEKADILRDDFGIEPVVTGISTGRHGRAIDERGLDVLRVLKALDRGESLDQFHIGERITDTERFVAICPADLVFEATPTNPFDGQPALDYCRVLINRGVHVVTANKGPVAFGYRELTALAAQKGVGFFFESTIVGGSPAVTLAREGFSAARLSRIEGIFNSTTHYILRHMQDDGMDFADALVEAQAIGVAETDPTLDVEGWDAAIKTAILANVFLGADILPAQVDREGITHITRQQIEDTRHRGQCTRLMCVAERDEQGGVRASVRPTAVDPTSPAGLVTYTGGLVVFHLDTMGPQALVDAGQGPRGTAYGMLIDMINLLRNRNHLKA